MLSDSSSTLVDIPLFRTPQLLMRRYGFYSLQGLILKVPKTLYDNFRGLYTAWLDIRSLVTEKIEAELFAFAESKSQNVKRLFESRTQDTLALPPIPLRRLCPPCYGPHSILSLVCFDANFQNRTVKGKGENGQAILECDLRDERLRVSLDGEATKVHLLLSLTVLIL